MTGADASYWDPSLTDYVQLNGSNLGSYSYGGPFAGVYNTFTTPLNTYGPGTYRDFSEHSASSGTCYPGYLAPGNTTGNGLTIQQPTISGLNGVWYLGGPLSANDGYFARRC